MMVSLARIFLIGCTLFCVSTAYALPEPPAKLVKMVEIFSEIEELAEDSDWQKAFIETEEIMSLYKEIRQNINENAAANEISDFKKKIKDFLKTVQKKDKEAFEEKYIELQEAFFKITDHYSFPKPLALVVIDKYLDEALEAAEKGDYDDVSSEMNEISEFFENLEGKLAKDGASKDDVENFSKTLSGVKNASMNKNKEEVEKGLETLKKISKTFVKLYS